MPPIAKELPEQVDSCSKNRIARWMKNSGIKAVAAKKCRDTTDSEHKPPVAENLLEQDFTAT